MTLTFRLSLFFLGALALVMVGFSTALYVMAEHYLYHQAQEQARERVDAALQVLAASARRQGKFDVEWRLSEPAKGLGQSDRSDKVLWMVESSNQVIERSANLGLANLV